MMDSDKKLMEKLREDFAKTPAIPDDYIDNPLRKLTRAERRALERVRNKQKR